MQFDEFNVSNWSDYKLIFSDRFFPKKNAFRFYHVAIDIIGKERKEICADAHAKNFFDLRYE